MGGEGREEAFLEEGDRLRVWTDVSDERETNSRRRREPPVLKPDDVSFFFF